MTNVWLIGAGGMAADYAKVLSALNCDLTVIGRGEHSAQIFREKTGLSVFQGGLDRFLDSASIVPDAAIVSVGVEQLAPATLQLLNYGVRRILVEKPGGLNAQEIAEVNSVAAKKGSCVFVAYNRRFYGSVLEAEKIIQADGGVLSFNFEVTEWGHIIENIQKAEGVKESWFMANTTHVADLAFFMGGKPRELSSIANGGCDWHPSATIFAGSGISEADAPFTYHGNWSAPGSWGVDISTSSHRLIFKPMESLKIQKIGSIAIECHAFENELDDKFKPGLYLQTKSFLSNNDERLCTIQEQLSAVKTYCQMAGYALPTFDVCT
ncbi:MAG: Gfo/Idh/MocA family oxidoreductase [Pseudomonadales bacterium]|nr:Gfo/Idh/MocA family oxidoreductase [Pseudomonadales bacterium]